MQNTLDPPGTIAVLGGGPVGIETALYARYLGYQVQLFEQKQLAHTIMARPEDSCPHPCTSPLGLAALAAQRTSGTTTVDLDLRTCADWVRDYLLPLTTCDLLRGSIHEKAQVTRLELAAAEDDVEANEELSVSDSDVDDDIPPDFLVQIRSEGNELGEQRFECILDARGAAAESILPADRVTELNIDYYFCVGGRADSSTDFASALRQIRDVFAELQDRPSLDVYKNLGGS